MLIYPIEHLRDKYEGLTCFMIGTGPSLTYEMLDKLQGKYTFAMNNISVAYPHTAWRPTFYLNVARSTAYDKHWRDCAIESILAAKHTFLWAKHLPLAVEKTNEKFNMSILSCHDFPSYSRQVHDCVSRFGTSMFSALQLADFMGFKTINLVGCDLGYIDSIDPETLEDTAHFDSEYLGDRKKKDFVKRAKYYQDEFRTIIAHKLTAMSTVGRGVWIRTCSDRLSHIYPRVIFEEALREAAV